MSNQKQEAIPQPLPHAELPRWFAALQEELRDIGAISAKAVVEEVSRRNKDALNEAMTRHHKMTKKKLALGTGLTFIGFVAGILVKTWWGGKKPAEVNSVPITAE